MPRSVIFLVDIGGKPNQTDIADPRILSLIFGDTNEKCAIPYVAYTYVRLAKTIACVAGQFKNKFAEKFPPFELSHNCSEKGVGTG